MITVKSSFDFKRAGSEYKNLLRRYRGNIIFYSALTFIFLTLQYILSLMEYAERAASDVSTAPYWGLVGPGALLNGLSAMFMCSAVIGVSIGSAVDMFGYMQNRRSTDLYHSLPLTRDELFAAHAAAGVTQIWIPLIINFLMVACLSVMAPQGGFVTTLIELFCWMMMTMAIFSITAFAAVQVGTLFDTALFSVGLNGVLPAIYLAVLMLAQRFLYGFEMGDFMELSYKLSPVSLIIGRQMLEITGVSTSAANTAALRENNIWIAVWSAAAIILFLVTARLYRRRLSEQAETVGNMGPLQIFLRGAGTFVGGTMLAFIFCELFSLGSSETTVLIATLLCSVTVYFVGDVLLSRTVRSIPKALPAAGITAACVTAVTAVILFGGLGYETRTPDPAKVASVTLDYYDSRYHNERYYSYNYNNSYYNKSELLLNSPEAIELIIAAQQQQIEAYKNAPETVIDGNGQLRVQYNLAGGGKMMRSYFGFYPETANTLSRLETVPEFLQQTHGIFYVGSDMVESVTARNAAGYRVQELHLDMQQKQQLIDALRADLLAQPYSEIENGTQALGYININYKILRSVLETMRETYYDGPMVVTEYAYAEVTALQAEPEYRHYSTEILVTESFNNTLAFFERHVYPFDSLGKVLQNDLSRVEKAYVAIEGNYLSAGESVAQTSSEDFSYHTDRVMEAYYDYQLDKFVANGNGQPNGFVEIDTAQLMRLKDSLTNIAIRNGEPYAIVALMTDKGTDAAGERYEQVGGCYYIPFGAIDQPLRGELIDAAMEYYHYDEQTMIKKGYTR